MGIAPNLPGAGIPEGVYLGSGMGSMQSITEESAKDSMKAPLLEVFDGPLGVFSAFAALWNGFTSLTDFLHNIVQALTGGGSGNAGALLDHLGDWAAGLGALIQNVQNFAQNIIDTLTGGSGSSLGDLGDWVANFGANFADLLAALTGGYLGSDSDLLDIADWSQGIEDGIAGATTAAINTVTSAMNEIISGNIVGTLAATIKSAIESVIDIIFGSGGSTWTQEVYLVSSQLQIGLNDLPLGFRMGYAGKITNIYVRVLANNATSGSAVLRMRKNAGSFTTVSLNTTDTNKSASGNWACAAGDIIDINCTQVHSAGTVSGISVSFVGKYN